MTPGDLATELIDCREQANEKDNSRDVHPSRLAAEFGLTEDEARRLRHDVEFGVISAPFRVEYGERIHLTQRQKEAAEECRRCRGREVDPPDCSSQCGFFLLTATPEEKEQAAVARAEGRHRQTVRTWRGPVCHIIPPQNEDAA